MSFITRASLLTLGALGGIAVVTTTACARSPDAAGEPKISTASAGNASPRESRMQAAPSTSTTLSATDVSKGLPRVLVHKSPTCGCCGLWVDHLRQAGFEVEVRNHDNLNPIKERVGVPYGKGSCHTAEVGGYFVEGHVPAEDIKRLLREGTSAKGLVLPGMPLGSPGMEVPDGTTQPYTVEIVDRNGATTAYARH